MSLTNSVYPYTFDNMSRIGNDNTAIDQRNLQNLNNTNYQTQNYYPYCPMSKAIDFATQQPNVFYNGSHEGGIKGCEIEANNELKFSHINRPACKISLNARPYLTVPYLGRGLGDPELELKIKTGENYNNRKTNNTTMEKCFSDYKNYPLMDDIKDSVTNTKYLIETDAMNGWTRGGMSAREHARSQDNKQ